ncbi:hypothetical protein [Butyrivibrio sp. JL13D10]|uniref:hypothetical protein n=1 Tax=Butyrivibrio sp. JL13D10 TaxID=3236815 RepID=UPI0038B520A3
MNPQVFMTRPWKKDDAFNSADVVGNEIHVILDDGVYVDSLNLLVRLQKYGVRWRRKGIGEDHAQ